MKALKLSIIKKIITMEDLEVLEAIENILNLTEDKQLDLKPVKKVGNHSKSLETEWQDIQEEVDDIFGEQ